MKRMLIVLTILAAMLPSFGLAQPGRRYDPYRGQNGPPYGRANGYYRNGPGSYNAYPRRSKSEKQLRKLERRQQKAYRRAERRAYRQYPY